MIRKWDPLPLSIHLWRLIIRPKNQTNRGVVRKGSTEECVPQVPDHDDPVHDSVPVKPELHVHDGAPAALAGHPTTTNECQRIVARARAEKERKKSGKRAEKERKKSGKRAEKEQDTNVSRSPTTLQPRTETPCSPSCTHKTAHRQRWRGTQPLETVRIARNVPKLTRAGATPRPGARVERRRSCIARRADTRWRPDCSTNAPNNYA